MIDDNKKTRKQDGFTLIEVMVVVVILGILALMVVPRIMGRPDEARVVKAQHDIRAIEAALNLYRLDNYQYPDSAEGIQMLKGKYLDRVPKDPWQNEYVYDKPGSHGLEFDLYSLGADGAQGGEEGVDKDIGNWEL